MNRDDVINLLRVASERGERPNLLGANLSGADLRYEKLSRADLSYANLEFADLRGADLGFADLLYANLRGINLRGAKIRDANLCGVKLRDADLRDTDLSYTNLRDADLRYTSLRGANLHGAIMHGANLIGANMRYTNLAMTSWDGFAIDGLHPYRILLFPTPPGWRITIGCWEGTPDDLRTLIAGDVWPEAEGDEITHRRPLLEAALHMVDAYIAAHPNVIDDLKERWE